MTAKQKSKNKLYSFIDFFSGAGGLSCGLEHVGFNPLLAVEISPVYAKTYKLNNPDTKVIEKDIRLIKTKEFKEIAGIKSGTLDLIAGGPPCQGFSINAPVRSLDDQRNHLFKDFLRLADELKPKIILIENVPGFISLGNGTVINTVYKELSRMGYKADHKILFAGHYGVPQLRFRTIIIATRLDIKISFPSPTHDAKGVANFKGAKDFCQRIEPLFSSNLKKQTTVWDAISDLPALTSKNKQEEFKYNGLPVSAYGLMLRSGSYKIYNHQVSNLAPINLERLKHIPQGGSWRDIPHELLPAGLKRARRSDHTKRYGRLHPEGLCSTILTKCDPHWGSFFHPFQDRIISVREAARIQSFPDKFTFQGSLTEQYQQVGNAVPPLMAQSIGEAISKMLSERK